MTIKLVILFLGNLISVVFAIRKIIYIAHRKNLFDEPSELRKIHTQRTPNLGGVAIFVSLFLSGCFFYIVSPVVHFNYLIAAAIILFGLGLTDDLLGVDPLKKFLTQLLVALLVACTTSLRLDQGLMPLLGITHLPYGFGVVLTAFFILFMMNAMNLIDGINGLAGSLALLSGIVFSILFWQLNDPFFLELSIALTACLLGFLYFNRTPACIFMGDTGSLLLGFVLSVFSIRLLESGNIPGHSADSTVFPAPVILLFALFMIPLLDTVRVFVLRIMHNKSPFAADRNHIHHLLIDLGIPHMRATGVLLGFNVIVILLSCLMKDLPVIPAWIFLILCMTALYAMVYEFKKRKHREITRLASGKFQTGRLRTFSVMTPGKNRLNGSASPAEKIPV